VFAGVELVFCVFASAWMVVGKKLRACGDLFFLQKTTLTSPISLHFMYDYDTQKKITRRYLHKISGVKIKVKFQTFNFFRIVSWSLMSR